MGASVFSACPQLHSTPRLKAMTCVNDGGYVENPSLGHANLPALLLDRAS